MFTIKSNETLYNHVANHYTQTSIETGHIGFVLNALKDFNRPFGESIVEYASEHIGTATTLAVVVSNLFALAKHAGKLDDKYSDEFRRIAGVVSEQPVEQSEDRGAYLSPKQAKDYLKGIESSVGRAVQCLAYTAGLTPNDLLRELNGLKYLKDGLAVVGERYHATNTAPRTVHFDPTLLNELDPAGELIDIVADIVSQTNADNAGIMGLCLSNYGKGWGYTIRDLRNSHAINLLEQGYLNSEVAEIQGVKVGSFTDRLRKFRRNAGLK